MNQREIKKKLSLRIKNYINRIWHHVVEETTFSIWGLPSEEVDCIKRYFKTHNAERYLSSYANHRIERVVMQIGMDKTASSSVQTFLDENRALLHQNKIEYKTDWGGNNHSVPLKSIVAENPQNIYHHMASGWDSETIDAYNSVNLLSMCKGIRDCQQKTYVFYGEGICSLKKSEYERLQSLLNILMPNGEIKILYCVRSNIGYASSAYQQAVKLGRYHDEDEQLKRYSNLYEKRLINAIKVFGENRIDVYAFEDTLIHEFGPVGFFLEKLGIDSSKISTLNSPHINESLSCQAIEIMAYINKKHPLILNGVKNKLRYREDTNPIMKIEGPRYCISNELASRIINKAQNDILWLKEHFGVLYPLKHQVIEETECSYDNAYYHSCIAVTNDLNDFLKGVFYEFIVEKLGSVNHERDQEIFKKIQKSMERNDD
jgi:hypothetical protein